MCFTLHSPFHSTIISTNLFSSFCITFAEKKSIDSDEMITEEEGILLNSIGYFKLCLSIMVQS